MPLQSTKQQQMPFARSYVGFNNSTEPKKNKMTKTPPTIQYFITDHTTGAQM